MCCLTKTFKIQRPRVEGTSSEGRSDEPRKVCCLRLTGKKGPRTKLRCPDPQMANVMMQHLIVDEQPPERLVRSGTEYLAPMVDLSTREGTTAIMSSTIMTVVCRYSTSPFLPPGPRPLKLTSICELLTTQLRRTGWSLSTSLARLARRPN